MICGKILLYKPDWEITYICELCYQELLTLPELLKHVFHEHVKDVPENRLRELCGEVKQEPDIEIGPETLTQPMVVINQIKQEQEELEHEEEEAAEENDQIEHVKSAKCEQNQDYTDDCAQSKEFEFLDVQRDEIPNNTKSKKRPYNVECNVCNTKFRRTRALMAHRRIHGDKPYVCEHCGARFADKNNMQVHCLRHLGTKRYSCTVCEKAFTTSTELKIHMRSHTGERPYKCSECDRRFSCASHRTKHQNRHKNIRSSLCTVCGKAFFDNKNLKSHLETHSTERPYQCEQCDAKFGSANVLRQHKLLHSDVKKYGCKLCSKTFAQGAGLYSHMKAVHKSEKNI